MFALRETNKHMSLKLQCSPPGVPCSSLLTLYQLVNTGDLPGAIQGVDSPDALWQVDVVGQGAGQVRQQGVKGPEPVRGYGVHYPVEVPVSVAVEADLLGSLLRAQSLQGPGPIQAAVGAVRGTRHPVHLGAGAAVPLTSVPVVEMLHLHLAAEAHNYGCSVWETKKREKAKERKKRRRRRRVRLRVKTFQQRISKQKREKEETKRGEVLMADKVAGACLSPVRESENNSLMTD